MAVGWGTATFLFRVEKQENRTGELLQEKSFDIFFYKLPNDPKTIHWQFDKPLTEH